MGAVVSSEGSPVSHQRSDAFSLMSGGPFNWLCRVLGLADPSSGRLYLRTAWIVPALAWLPLLVLSMPFGQSAGASPERAFAADYEVHARFLLSLPLLLIAEAMTEQCMAPLLSRLHARNLVSEGSLPLLAGALGTMKRGRESLLPEIVIALLVYSVGLSFVISRFSGTGGESWYAGMRGGSPSPTLACYWYVLVSLPLFQFLMLRWYHRLWLWAQFLWRLSKVPLQVLPAHPDQCGGLGFLLVASRGFLPLAAAHGALLTGYMAYRVLSLQEPIMDFKGEVLAMVVFVLCITLVPLLAFYPRLRKAKHLGLEEYGCLAADYVSQFQATWLRGGSRAERPLLGAADIQSLSDLGGSYSLVKAMRTSLFQKEEPVRFAAATLIPLAPLLVAAIPLEQIVKKLAGILF